ncbi:heme ABC exporter ATP-binding protein CcmA [Aureimonas altamirensis]|uniref:heme ABC exporter ATP-binding protein CcmA n=1 Tax=Aureimonas altamirensis TaxID=370622 RepID=UPI0030198818
MGELRLEGVVIGRQARALGPPLSLALRGGEALVVSGPNGAGKSTLLRTLAGLTPALAGRVSIHGLNAPDGEPASHPGQVCHYIGHRNGLKPLETLARNVAFWRDYLGGDRTGVDDALAAFDLQPLAAIPAGYLSAGQQRRAALCRLLAAWRPLWLLDEPTNALDTASQALFARAVASHLSKGGMVVAATHQPLELGPVRELVLAAPRAGTGEAQPVEEWQW